MDTVSAPVETSHRNILVVFSGLVLVMLLAALDSTIVATALPTIVGELGGLDHLSWVVTAYLLAQTVVTPLYGKLGDLYGRKVVLQVGIVLFLLGSVLCGMSSDMTQLIIFRALQGLGGGGLMVTSQAVVGDIVPPRDRGRYQGIFGAVFGVASIAGPLIGGYLTTHLSWRWIFYVNLPLGVIALAVLAATLPGRGERVQRTVDYAGAGLLAAALSAIILVTDLGGTEYAWSSSTVVALMVIAGVSLAAFLAVERRASEPILPLRLFRNRAFWVATTVGLIVGFALFGSVTYLPLFLQVVKGESPTESGMQMLPLMGGMLVTSILSGQIISRTGRYRLFPIVGTAVMTAGLFLLSQMTPSTTILSASLEMLMLGMGMGFVMQVLVISVQNAVDYRDLGSATSGVILFRFIGGSLGTAVLGAIFSARLQTTLATLLPPGTGTHGTMNPQAMAQLPPEVRGIYAEAFTTSLDTVFLVATAIAALGFLLAWLLPERPLRETIAATTEEDIGNDVGETFAMPTDSSSITQLLRGASVLADRDVKRKSMEAIVRRARLDLTPLAAWLLVQFERDPNTRLEVLATAKNLDLERLRASLHELRQHGYVEERRAGETMVYGITERGCNGLKQLVEARRAHIEEIMAEWGTGRPGELAATLQRIAQEIIPEPRTNLAAR